MKTSQVVVIVWKDPVSRGLDAAVEHLDRLPVVVVQRLNVRSHKLASLALGPRQGHRLQLLLQTPCLSRHHL